MLDLKSVKYLFAVSCFILMIFLVIFINIYILWIYWLKIKISTFPSILLNLELLGTGEQRDSKNCSDRSEPTLVGRFLGLPFQLSVDNHATLNSIDGRTIIYPSRSSPPQISSTFRKPLNPHSNSGQIEWK